MNIEEEPIRKEFKKFEISDFIKSNWINYIEKNFEATTKRADKM